MNIKSVFASSTLIPLIAALLCTACAWLTPSLTVCTPALAATATGTTNKTITFGYLRIAGVDDPSLLAIFLSVIKEANEGTLRQNSSFLSSAIAGGGILGNYRIVPDVTTIHCGKPKQCRFKLIDSVAANGPMMTDDPNDPYTAMQTFLAKMPTMTAILRPNHIFTPYIIDAVRAAKAAGASNIPIIVNPQSIAKADYAAGSDFIMNFGHFITNQIAHIFTFMQQYAGCAYSGIFYEQFSEMEDHVDYVQQLFAAGGLPVPPAIDAGSATVAELLDFVFQDERRRCFITLTTSATYLETMQTLVDNGGGMFIPTENRFFGTYLLAGTQFKLRDGSTNAFEINYAHWFPPMTVTDATMSEAARDNALQYQIYGTEIVQRTFDLWLADSLADPNATDAALFNDTDDQLPTATNDFMMSGYLMMTMLLQTIRSTLGRSGGEVVDVAVVNETISAVVPTSNITEVMYSEARRVLGYPFYHLVERCESLPFPETCYCNTAPRTSYIYYVDTQDPSQNGVPRVRFDDQSLGQRDIATLSFPESCGYEASSWSYPITSLLLFPELTSEVAITDVFSYAFGEMTRSVNYAENRPARPYRYTPFIVPSASSTDQILASYTDSYNPFAIIGSVEGNIENTSVLTIYPNVYVETEDPPIGTNQLLLQIQPVLADYIHTMVAFYRENEEKYTRVVGSSQFASLTPPIGIITQTDREAELVSLSFATFGYDVPVSMIVVSSDSDEWVDKVTEWLSSTSKKSNIAGTDNLASPNPFVLAVTARNSVLFGAWAAARRLNTGTLAVAAGDTVIHNATALAMNLTNLGLTSATTAYSQTTASSADIVFSAMAREWWPSDSRLFSGVPSSLNSYRQHPRLLTALIGFMFMQTLAGLTNGDYLTTAADVLYTTQNTITMLLGTFGPFSNETCTAEQIAENTRDRTCQCYKGPRTFYVHSLKNREAMARSTRTARFSYTYGTCGVVYADNVQYAAVVVGKTLSSGAIAGIAVGVSVAVIGVIVTFVLLNIFCFGRNNRAAPKDPTKPFSIVFTDIQSSTALWARAPQAMSEAVEDHHRLLRKILRRNDGYEVKTVGDSFMIAFKEIEDAVAFSLEAQIVLFEYDGWSTEIDAIYVELLAEAEVEKETNNQNATNPTATKDVDTFTVSQTSLSAIHNYNHNNGVQSIGVPALYNHNYATSHNARSACMSLSYEASHNHLPTPTNNYKNSHNVNFSRQESGVRLNVVASEHNATNSTGKKLSPALSPRQQQQQGSTIPSGSARVTELSTCSELPLPPDAEAPINRSFNGGNDIEAVSLTRKANAALDEWNAATTESDRDALFIHKGKRLSAQLPLAHNNNNNNTAAYNQHQHHAPSLLLQAPSSHMNPTSTFNIAQESYATSSGATDRKLWHGLRVRIGVHYGHGDIRKDPVSLGYDYYGTVVNTAARVEGVGHGGQILLTGEAFAALGGSEFTTAAPVPAVPGNQSIVTSATTANGTTVTATTTTATLKGTRVASSSSKAAAPVVIALGPQPLRGLDEPIRLYQLLPASLAGRTFPALRLHIEKETEDDETDLTTTTGEGGTSSAASNGLTPEELAQRLCSSKQYATQITADALLLHYYFFLATFGPTKDKYRVEVISKLGSAWGFEKAAKALGGSGGSKHEREAMRTRLTMTLLAKILKTFRASRRAPGRDGLGDLMETLSARSARGGGVSYHSMHRSSPSLSMAR